MKASKTTDKIELAKLSKLIIKLKVTYVRRYDIERMKWRKCQSGEGKLGISANQMYALRENSYGNSIYMYL